MPGSAEVFSSFFGLGPGENEREPKSNSSVRLIAEVMGDFCDVDVVVGVLDDSMVE